MRIFLAGDYLTGTGPANVTKYYIENLPKGTLYQKFKSKPARVLEIVFNTLRADIVVYSGYSKQNVIGMKIARKLSKPSAYIMHGCVEYENEINLEVDETMCRVERQILSLADAVYAVSPSFANWLRVHYPESADKIDYVTNGIDRKLYEEMLKRNSEANDSERSHMIFSIGGGMPRKKIKHICEAVEILRQTYDADLRLTVVGAVGADSEAINAYPFVDNLGKVAFDETVKLFQKADVFVQNSSFETFGLAPVEAIACGSSVLCTGVAGALAVIDNIRDEDVINNYEDASEIAEKIKHLIEEPNNEYLRKSINWEQSSWEHRSRELLSKLEKLVQS